MQTENVTVHTLAAEVLSMFGDLSRKSDDTGRQARGIPGDNAPDWVTALCREAHGDMLPDDWRYEMIESALECIAESESEYGAWERMTEVEPPVYTHERLRWLASHLDRPGYCDKAVRDRVPADSIVNAVAMGWLAEFEEVFGSVFGSLRERAREVADAE